MVVEWPVLGADSLLDERAQSVLLRLVERTSPEVGEALARGPETACSARVAADQDAP